MIESSNVDRVRAAAEGRLDAQEVWGPAAPAFLEAQWQAFERFMAAAPGPIYGVTTLTGHRDGEAHSLTPVQINRAIADSHWFEPTSEPDDGLWRLITLTKLAQMAIGGTPVRLELFNALAAGLAAGRAGRIDMNASYSSGDVIPACQWALQSLRFAGLSVDDLAPGEMIALINGDFVHLGSALWAAERIGSARLRNDAQGRRAARLLSASGRYAQRQFPVSFRAMEDVSAALASTERLMDMTADRLLGSPSGNPLFHVGPPSRMESQASFLATDLSLAQGSLIEASLALAWIISRRIQHLCEAFHDGASLRNPIALIQKPKLAEARLEALRLRHGVRTFASGGVMSEGVEDFWTRGLMTSAATADIAAGLTDMLRIEADVMDWIEAQQQAV